MGPPHYLCPLSGWVVRWFCCVQSGSCLAAGTPQSWGVGVQYQSLGRAESCTSGLIRAAANPRDLLWAPRRPLSVPLDSAGGARAIFTQANRFRT